MKTNQEVKLLFISPLWLISNGIRYSHNNHYLSDTLAKDAIDFDYCPYCHTELENHSDEFEYIKYCKVCNVSFSDRIGSKDFNLIKRVGFKYKHESTLEHSIISYHVKCSRAMLQELSRHRHISLTVKSTRYTLKELKNEEPFYLESDWHCQDTEVGKRAAKYIKFTGRDRTDHNSIVALENLRQDIEAGVPNDEAKYSLPESFWTEMQLTLNLRELLHILVLRTAKDALKEFRIVAYNMFKVLPDDYKELILCDKQIAKQIESLENAND